MSQISCMSFNILSYDTWYCGFEPAATRIKYVLNTVKENDPDLVGVQEACELGSSTSEQCDFEWCGNMIAEMEKLGYGHSAVNEQPGFKRDKQNIACGLIIFFKKDRFVLNESDAFEYPHDKVRYFQWAKLTDTKYDKPILFTNTHFSINPRLGSGTDTTAGDAFRATESYMLLKFWLQNCTEGVSLYATGDYNSKPSSAAQTLLRSKTFKPSFLIPEIPDEIGTVNLAQTANIIDYCFVNPDVQAVKQYKVITTTYPSEAEGKCAGMASDHRAIMTYCDYK